MERRTNPDFVETAMPAMSQRPMDDGANLSVRDERGLTSLYHSAMSSRGRIVVDTLLAAGADVNARGERRQTLLHAAAAFNDEPTVSPGFIKGGADLSALSVSGDTALWLAAQANPNSAVINAGSDVGWRCPDGPPPHAAACDTGKLPIVGALLKGGANAMDWVLRRLLPSRMDWPAKLIGLEG